MTTEEQEFEQREFVGAERQEIRGIMWHFRIRKKIRDAAKAWLLVAGTIAGIAGVASTMWNAWIK
jgi:hypothetical protein